MRASLYFKEIGCHIAPYLWNDEAGSNPQAGESHAVKNLLDIDIAFDGYRNRISSLTLVESRQTALALASIARSEEGGESIITRLGEDTWCVGTTLVNGEYGSRIPQVTDARFGGEPLSLDVDDELADEMEIEVISFVGDPPAIEIGEAAVYDQPDFG